MAKIESRFDQFGFRFGSLAFRFLQISQVSGFLGFESFFAAKVPVMSLEKYCVNIHVGPIKEI